ncbi:MAG: flagellar biosynthetic protein FliO [Pseudomonadota bacterium]
MMTTPEIGVMFLKTSGMLLVVIAVLLAVLYAVRRVSSFKGMRGKKSLIHVAAMHHFSPREKVALVTVYDKTLLIGLTAQAISCLATFDAGGKEAPDRADEPRGFREILQGLGRPVSSIQGQDRVADGSNKHED